MFVGAVDTCFSAVPVAGFLFEGMQFVQSGAQEL
jgi:hypothetical protein